RRDQGAAARRVAGGPDAVPAREGDPRAGPGHPNIIELLASGESDNPNFIPPPIRDRIDNDFLILELMDLSLEERLKGARNRRQRDDLLVLPPRERLFRVLDYMVPVATAIEYAH